MLHQVGSIRERLELVIDGFPAYVAAFGLGIPFLSS